MTGLKKCCKLLENNGWVDITETQKDFDNGMFQELNNMVKILNKGGIKVNPVYKPIYRPSMINE